MDGRKTFEVRTVNNGGGAHVHAFCGLAEVTMLPEGQLTLKYIDDEFVVLWEREGEETECVLSILPPEIEQNSGRQYSSARKSRIRKLKPRSLLFAALERGHEIRAEKEMRDHTDLS